MGSPPKYTEKTLERAVKKYFRSITRQKQITEAVPTGQRDKYGHMIFEQKPVLNDLGKAVWVTEYIVPPEMAALYDFLKIDRSTWNNYADHDLHPEMTQITEFVYERMKAWNERELLTRPGKDLKGIVFNLENNYGYRERLEATVKGGVDELLGKLAQEGAEGTL